MSKHICLWSGPRNISTALMYSFAQRSDCKVVDEPLYAYYLKHHPEARQYHPGADDVLNNMEKDGNKVIEEMFNNKTSPMYFYKHMTHHLLDLDRSFMKKTINIILTRDPNEMLPSFAKVIPNPTINDVGYRLHVELLNYFKLKNISFVVLDSKSVLLNPHEALRSLCQKIDIPFEESMLSWKPQKREEDGVWARYWYDNVHKSSGFMPYKAKEEAFPERLQSLLEESQRHYETLLQYAL
ncbi:sulfotransferase family protein [Winogradskyella maritima]|uniref:Sulfotransferase family protein n=1 Tax=Winogradskyella maritima TaxID=1517766 RepID=A0ABV8ALJ5_9FLAO|nr:sulfotransferase family protein [Winogradskyella maritima]